MTQFKNEREALLWVAWFIQTHHKHRASYYLVVEDLVERAVLNHVNNLIVGADKLVVHEQQRRLTGASLKTTDDKMLM